MNPSPVTLAAFDIEKFTQEYLIPASANIGLALLIFIVGRWLSKRIVILARKALERGNFDKILVDFIGSILGWVLTLVVLVAALDRLGVETTSMIALLGAAGLAVGLALKDSLQNFASGVLLIIFRPFKVGDFVEAAGVEGSVEEIRIFSTMLRTPDNREVIVPNSDVYSGAITNNNARDTRRIDLVVGIGYDDDLRKAKKILEDIINADDRVLEDPEPLVAVGELGGSSVDLLVRPWVNTPDYFATKCDLTEKIKLGLDDAGISIPYPQMDVHLDKAAAA